jgi:pilus assembly protein CpaC
MLGRYGRLASLACLSVASFSLALVPPGIARAAPAAEEARVINVEAGSSHHLRLGATISRVSVGAADIADVAPFPPDQLLVTGKRVGQTTVTVWFRNDEIAIFTIRCAHPVSAMNDAMTRAMPDGKDVRATSAGSAVVLSGEVQSPGDVEHAEQIARGIAGEGVQIVNLLRVPGDNQVQIEVSFAEVSRTALKEIGVNLWAKDKGGTDGPQWTGGLTTPTSAVNGIAATPATGATDTLSLGSGLPVIQTPLSGAFGAVFSTAAGSKFPFAAALSVLSSRGYARTLSEPTLVALSGQPATFLAGGEFPIPMPQSLGQIGIDYRKFGVQLQFVPTVMGQNIQLKMAATVSDIDFSLGVRLAAVTVPGLTERHSETTVRLRDGESFAIAGLLSDKVRSNVDKVPGLGDLPVLGLLFRSTSYRRDETELLVVVTAHLVRPLGDRPQLPGEDTLGDPSDLELFLVGSIESKEAPDDRLHPHRRTRPQGPVGFAR